MESLGLVPRTVQRSSLAPQLCNAHSQGTGFGHGPPSCAACFAAAGSGRCFYLSLPQLISPVDPISLNRSMKIPPVGIHEPPPFPPSHGSANPKLALAPVPAAALVVMPGSPVQPHRTRLHLEGRKLIRLR